MVQTASDNVIVNSSTGETLADRLAQIATDISNAIAGGITPSQVDAKISAAISALINEAPETYDTLKEIADYISTNETAMAALNAAIGNKVDKVTGKGLSANDFTDTLLAKLNGIAAGATKVEGSTTNGNVKIGGTETAVYTHPATAGNKHIPAGGTAGQILENDGSGTAKWANPKQAIRVGTTVPADLAEGELFIKILN
jgi:hypothetical protein